MIPRRVRSSAPPGVTPALVMVLGVALAVAGMVTAVLGPASSPASFLSPAAASFTAATPGDPPVPESGDGWRAERRRMVEQIRRRGVTDARVLAAMEEVPRHRFVPPSRRAEAYGDHPLPIGHGQTISQPLVVALMTELLDLQAGDRVLEIGTGSAYHAAVLSRLAAEVYTVEIVEPLGRRAEALLAELGYDNVHVRIGDGYQGWPEAAPFDAVLLTAAPPEIPRPLLDQLAEGGKLVAPVGEWFQRLEVVTRTEKGLETRTLEPVRFVPMTGRAQGEGPPVDEGEPGPGLPN